MTLRRGQNSHNGSPTVGAVRDVGLAASASQKWICPIRGSPGYGSPSPFQLGGFWWPYVIRAARRPPGWRRSSIAPREDSEQSVTLDRAGVTVFRDILFLAAGPTSERSRSVASSCCNCCQRLFFAVSSSKASRLMSAASILGILAGSNSCSHQSNLHIRRIRHSGTRCGFTKSRPAERTLCLQPASYPPTFGISTCRANRMSAAVRSTIRVHAAESGAAPPGRRTGFLRTQRPCRRPRQLRRTFGDNTVHFCCGGGLP